MKISSRPSSTGTTGGTGQYTVDMTFEQLQFIGALLHITRLGTGSTYRQAAYELMGTLEEMFDCHFTEESSYDVDLSVSKVDDSCNIIELIHYTDACLEV